MEKKGTLWCETKNKPAPYNKLPLLPIDFSRDKLIGTVFEDDYKEETLPKHSRQPEFTIRCVHKSIEKLVRFWLRQGKTTLDNIAKGTPPGNRSYDY